MENPSSYVLRREELNNIVGIFLLILAVCGNFVAETLSCQLQKLLSTNMFAKNAVILMVIYFALGFTSDSAVISPVITMFRSFMIWVFFIIFNKMSLMFTMAAFAGLFGILICKNFADYYHELDAKKNKELIELLVNFSSNLFKAVCLTILAGFILYFSKQYRDHSKNFSYTIFLFGKNKCASME